MEGVSMTSDFPELEDMQGLLVKAKMYTHILYCFPMPDASVLSQVVNTLNMGVEKLSESVPWISGHVFWRAAQTGLPARAIVVRTTSPFTVGVNDLSNSTTKNKDGIELKVPSYEQLQATNFPFSMLESSLFIPDHSLTSFTYDEKNPLTTILVHLTVLKGGLVLDIAGDHGIVDGQGLNIITGLLSKACRNEPLPPEEVLVCNQPRGDVIPLLTLDLNTTTDITDPGLLTYLLPRKGMVSPLAKCWDKPDCHWTYIHFPASSLLFLKNLAMASKPSDVPYITTNDVFSAFLWQVISRARAPRLEQEQKLELELEQLQNSTATNENTDSNPQPPPQRALTSKFCRAIDIRAYFSLSPSYTGNMVSHAFTTQPISTICGSSLGALAGLLRSDLKPEPIIAKNRALATYLATNEDHSLISPGGKDTDLSQDIWFSSWARLRSYEYDFGLGLGQGKAGPERVRIPRLTPLEGMVYLLPVDREGGIDVALCLKDVDLERLKAVKEVEELGRWIG